MTQDEIIAARYFLQMTNKEFAEAIGAKSQEMARRYQQKKKYQYSPMPKECEERLQTLLDERGYNPPTPKQ